MQRLIVAAARWPFGAASEVSLDGEDGEEHDGSFHSH